MALRRRQVAQVLGRLIALQAVVAVLIAGLFFFFGGPDVGRSALYGSFIALLPNLYLAARMVRVSEKGAREIVRALYGGEMVKFLLTAGLFTFVLMQPAIRPLPLFMAFAAVALTNWFALLIDWRDR